MKNEPLGILLIVFVIAAGAIALLQVKKTDNNRLALVKSSGNGCAQSNPQIPRPYIVVVEEKKYVRQGADDCGPAAATNADVDAGLLPDLTLQEYFGFLRFLMSKGVYRPGTGFIIGTGNSEEKALAEGKEKLDAGDFAAVRGADAHAEVLPQLAQATSRPRFVFRLGNSLRPWNQRVCEQMQQAIRNGGSGILAVSGHFVTVTALYCPPGSFSGTYTVATIRDPNNPSEERNVSISSSGNISGYGTVSGFGTVRP